MGKWVNLSDSGPDLTTDCTVYGTKSIAIGIYEVLHLQSTFVGRKATVAGCS